jgi:hypothetical protein
MKTINLLTGLIISLFITSCSLASTKVDDFTHTEEGAFEEISEKPDVKDYFYSSNRNVIFRFADNRFADNSGLNYDDSAPIIYRFETINGISELIQKSMFNGIIMALSISKIEISDSKIRVLEETSENPLTGKSYSNTIKTMLILPQQGEIAKWQEIGDNETSNYKTELVILSVEIEGNRTDISTIKKTDEIRYMYEGKMMNSVRIEYWGKDIGLLFGVGKIDGKETVILYNTILTSLSYSEKKTISDVHSKKMQNEKMTNITNPDKNNIQLDILNLKTSDILLTEDDLIGLSKKELKILRNEIYARHGYIFKSKDLQDYFSNKSWYSPMYKNVAEKLSTIEIKNINFIKKHE